MKIPTFIKRKKLRASTARRSLVVPEMEYEEMSEPNMKLSRALLIVLVLHVVAVAGIIAFNTIKTKQGSFPTPVATKNMKAKTAAVAPVNPPVAANATASAPVRHEATKASHASPPTAAKEERKTEHPKQATRSSVADSGTVYVVAKGDNPVTIARKLKVSYDDLIALNHIEDPRKLQIGQKLLIPAKPTKTKKSGD
jgi:LysM repeat protein